jgi:hypothetical protein
LPALSPSRIGAFSFLGLCFCTCIGKKASNVLDTPIKNVGASEKARNAKQLAVNSAEPWKHTNQSIMMAPSVRVFHAANSLHKTLLEYSVAEWYVVEWFSSFCILVLLSPDYSAAVGISRSPSDSFSKRFLLF